MTPIGHIVMGVISLIVVVLLMFKSALHVKNGGNGWEVILLIPVLLFLANSL